VQKIFEVYFHEEFRILFSKLENREKERLRKIFFELEVSFSGRPLGVAWLKEKRVVDSKRVYYVCFAEVGNKILVVGFSHKKTQQKNIDEYKSRKFDFKKYLDSKD
jgi:sulfatase maturation enzyme AslB (radical SAM superfamily)